MHYTCIKSEEYDIQVESKFPQVSKEKENELRKSNSLQFKYKGGREKPHNGNDNLLLNNTLFQF